MKLRVYNTLSRKKEELEPLVEGKINMYACGITVYDQCHIGHARQAIVYDIISRYLKYRGYDVTYVRNYTDIDDKIIRSARDLGVNALDYSREKILDAETDLGNLGIADADISPKVSENIDEIIKFVEEIIEKGYAYVTREGNVYFEVKKYTDYGKLSNRKVEDMLHGVRKELDEDKKDPLDFALWKKASEGEASWDSPWGKGRPGWHIECSAMSIKYLGETFDIHGGGKDLIFPHHENEIAQSEANTGKMFAKYWIHNGLVTIHGQKMSKSLGNSVTIKEALSRYDSEVIRFSMLNNHYSSDIDLSFDTFDASEKQMYYFYKTLSRSKALTSSNTTNEEPEELSTIPGFDKIDSIESCFIDAMDDDFNTSLAISNLYSVFKYINEIIANKKMKMGNKHHMLELANQNIGAVCAILGILEEDPDDFIKRIKEKYLIKNNVSVEYIEKKIQERQEAKASKKYDVADSIRQELGENGIVLSDLPGGVEWDFKDLL